MKPSLVIGERPDGSFEVIQIGNDPEASRQALAKFELDPSFVEVAHFNKPVAYRRRYPIRVLNEQAIARAEAEANAAAKAALNPSPSVSQATPVEQVSPIASQTEPVEQTSAPVPDLTPVPVAVSNDTAVVPAADLPNPEPTDSTAGFFADLSSAELADPEPTDSGQTIKPSKPAVTKGKKTPPKANG
ncbi:MAG: hypothetical protein JWM68_2519 [Verrucomicrobiales bacterium]|nr:hypothetical protein [Verrucomicrobiales bacterium]